MPLHLILGPTGSGKTGRATGLAAGAGGVVYSLDRYQIYPELATGTARADPEELRGVDYHFLCTRVVEEGEWPAEAALSRLGALLSRHEDHDLVILEGGSISLVGALLGSRLLDRREVTVEYHGAGDAALHRERLFARAFAMVQPPAGQRSILQEFAFIADRPRRAWVEAVDGYRALRSWLTAKGLTHHDLGWVAAEPTLLREIGDAIAEQHVRYADLQAAAFRRCTGELEQRTWMADRAAAITPARA